MDELKFVSAMFVYNKHKNSDDPKTKQVCEYSANLFAQYFALACKMKGDMIPTLEVVYQKASNELIQRGEGEARAQGIIIPNISSKK